MQWIIDNANWIFSGIGVVIVTGLGYIVKPYLKRSSQGQSQKVDNGSVAIQAGRDIQIGKSNKRGVKSCR